MGDTWEWDGTTWTQRATSGPPARYDLELHADGDFSHACYLGTYLNTTQVIDTGQSPLAGDGNYYLVSGTCASPIGYGNSSTGPRVGLPGPATPCP